MDPTAPTHALGDMAGLAWFQVDADRNLVVVSPEMEELTGFRADDLLGRSCLLLHRCDECLKGCGVFDHGDVREQPLHLWRADGSSIRVVKSGRTLRDAQGRIAGAVELVHPVERGAPAAPGPDGEGRAPAFRDADEPRAGAAAAVLESLGRTFLLADETFRVVAHGPHLEELLGAECAGIVGRPLADVLGPGLFSPGAALRAALEAGERREGWHAELRGDADGETPGVSVSAAPLDEPVPIEGTRARYSVMIRPLLEAPAAPAFHGIVARSAPLQRIFRIIELLRDNDSTVLITGESGTGKELVARALHANSHRKDGPFVAVNCAAIPSELLESELFGHVRGAFTGAVRDRVGRFETAAGGTLFLDEIGDLALPLQAKILRFLQEHSFERVGEGRTRTVDVRVLAATHVNLIEAVSDRRFREDLYYRLRVVPLHIPPLRERRDDLELLLRHFLSRIGRDRGRALRLSQEAGRALLEYGWPGNVRELENALEYATTVCEEQTIQLRDLPPEIAEGRAADPDVAEADAPSLSPDQTAEAARILRALQAARFRRKETAEALGISRSTLWRRMKALGI